ncbi:MAG: DUF1177 domain-containing protein [Thermoplasmatales archaeon]|jgi:hypothetical protein|nr:DUF1177 domain-containing protein [Candidatus Thermoplasmatota archaeon]MDA8055371.1 DUF1177 domain-containing protein [Thermoplasmatales archaeon]
MLSQVIEIHDLLDDGKVTGSRVEGFFQNRGSKNVRVRKVKGEKGFTEFIRIVISGRTGKLSSGKSPTLGIIGRLGGIGSRPERVGLVSDGDGAIAALSIALKLIDMQKRSDFLEGDVIVTTHICPNSPIVQHEPVPFMGSPVDMDTMNENEVDGSCDAILSLDTTKGNRIINFRGFAISPTIKDGWILPPSQDLVRIMEITTGQLARVLPVATQDITPYKNGLRHINSILQPSTATGAPVVGVAISTETAVPGSATGASHETDIEEVSRFCIEVAKEFGKGSLKFYDEKEFKQLTDKYGNMKHLQEA